MVTSRLSNVCHAGSVQSTDYLLFSTLPCAQLNISGFNSSYHFYPLYLLSFPQILQSRLFDRRLYIVHEQQVPTLDCRGYLIIMFYDNSNRLYILSFTVSRLGLMGPITTYNNFISKSLLQNRIKTQPSSSKGYSWRVV